MELIGIDNALKRKGLTRQELADYLRVTVSGLGKYIRGEREAPYDTLKKMCIYLELSVDTVMGIVEDENVLPADEITLLARYRNLSPDGKEILRAKALEMKEVYPSIIKSKQVG